MKANKLIILPLLLVTILVISFSYALFQKQVQINNKTVTIKSGNKYIGIYGENKNNIELNKDYTFTIENRGSIGTGYEVYIESTTNISLSNITYTVGGAFTKTGNLSDNVLVYSALSSADSKTITLRLTGTGEYTGKLKVRYKDYIVNYNYNGTNGSDGSEQTFITLTSGNYKLETWGAQGGNANGYIGGYGAYAQGYIHLAANEKIYISVGGSGATNHNNATPTNGGYNGGGLSRRTNRGDGAVSYKGSGGGATHIATASGILSSLSGSIESVIMVAGGGGGAANFNNSQVGNGGNAGGIVGSSGVLGSGNSILATGGTQITGGTGGSSGTFGAGAEAVSNNSICSNAGGTGGGAGLYGGGSGYNNSGAGGGSSYIANSLLSNKAMYCFDCQESNDVETYTVSTTGNNPLKDSNNCPDGYSSNPISKCAKAGNGYVRITYLGT